MRLSIFSTFSRICLLLLFIIVSFNVINLIYHKEKRVVLENLKDHVVQYGVSRVSAWLRGDDVICLDRYGMPISREEVTLAGSPKVEKVFITIGISTIKRRTNGSATSYLERSLHSHLGNLTDAEKREMLIVIFLADWEKEKRDSIQERLNRNFYSEIKSNRIKLIYAPRRFYRRFSGLPRNYNDSPKRVRWRSKQTLDYAFLAYYCSGLGDYYLHIEDDIESVPGYYKLIKDDLSKTEVINSRWSIRQYWYLGFIGMLIKDEVMRGLADFWRINYFEMPLDWSYEHFLGLMSRSGRKVVSAVKPFTHLGKQSSSLNDEVP